MTADTRLNHLPWEPGGSSDREEKNIFDQGHARINSVSIKVCQGMLNTYTKQTESWFYGFT